MFCSLRAARPHFMSLLLETTGGSSWIVVELGSKVLYWCASIEGLMNYDWLLRDLRVFFVLPSSSLTLTAFVVSD